MKRCSKCRELKQLSCFAKDKTKGDGLRYACSVCRAGVSKNYKRKPSLQLRFSVSKRTAKNRSIDWQLTINDYKNIIAHPCFYCNNELCAKVVWRCGLDRLDSNIGYTISNVVSCCFICNTIKGAHLTAEETKAAVATVMAMRK